jgi:hypothetical protein
VGRSVRIAWLRRTVRIAPMTPAASTGVSKAPLVAAFDGAMGRPPHTARTSGPARVAVQPGRGGSVRRDEGALSWRT